jgi:putative addiction module killer protein
MPFRVLTTSEFDDWLALQTPKTRTIIKSRLDFISRGHFGNHKRFDGLIELRWLNGIRVYSFLWGDSVIIALYGGNKNGQDKDIRKAKKIRDEVLEGTRTFFK